MGQLTRAQILAATSAANLPKEQVEFLDGYVWVLGMTGAQRDEFERSNYKMRKGRVEPQMHNLRARLAVRVMVDEAGQRIFEDSDAEALGNLSAAQLQKVYEVSQRLSGLTDEDLDEAKKPSESAAGSASSSN